MALLLQVNRVLEACHACVCWLSVLRVAASFSLYDLSLLVHLDLSSLSQTFELELHLLHL